MQDWTKALPALDLDAVPAFYPMPAAEHRRPNIELDETRQLFRTPTGRRTVNAIDCPNAFRVLERLPIEGEDFHVVTKGNSPLFDIIPWILEKAAPATVAWAAITPLGFSRQNVADLCALLDAGKIARLDFVYSAFFRSVEKDAVGYLADALQSRGQRVLAARCHAKLMLFETSDGRCFTNSGSGNLRACRSIETFTLSNGRDVLEFHKGWLTELFRKGERK